MTAEAEIEGGEAAARRRPSRWLFLAVGAMLLLLAAGAASYFFFFSGTKSTVGTTRDLVVPETFIFNLPAMTVNLNSEGEGEQFMKLVVALEVANEEVMTEIQPRLAKVVDAFQVYLRELRKSDLEGSAGIYRLKEELRRRVNIAIFPAQIESILFREILVQ